MKTQFLSAARGLFLLLAIWMNVLPALCAQKFGESCYYYLGDYPNQPPNPGWQQDVQGVAHDRDHWFITQERKIWKIPVGYDLYSTGEGTPGVITRSLCDATNLCMCVPDFFSPELWKCQTGYNHFGDPECYETNGQTFLLVPVERQPDHPAIALFSADSLAYLDHADLDQQIQAPWCAVDPQGNVYTSNFDVNNDNPIRKYTVDWDRVIASGTLRLTLTNSFWLTNDSGTFMTLSNVQGGVITPSGTLLYLVAGYNGQLRESDGIHVFDLASGRRVQRSTLGFGSFNFEFDPTGVIQEEPEGLTFWDLDDGRAPGISGQLHVLLLDNDCGDPDDVYFKHYAGILHVDRSYSGPEVGSHPQHFNTVNEANNLIWDGAQIRIKSGSYPEALTFSKRIALVSSGGPVTIGR